METFAKNKVPFISFPSEVDNLNIKDSPVSVILHGDDTLLVFRPRKNSLSIAPVSGAN